MQRIIMIAAEMKEDKGLELVETETSETDEDELKKHLFWNIIVYLYFRIYKTLKHNTYFLK